MRRFADRPISEILRTDRFNADIFMLNMPYIFGSSNISSNMSSDHGPARCGTSVRGGCRGGRSMHQGRGYGPPGFEPGFSAGLCFGRHPMGPAHGWPRHGPPPHDGPRHGSHYTFPTNQFDADIMRLNMPPFISESANISSNIFSDHEPMRRGLSARGGGRGGRGGRDRHRGRGDGPQGFGVGSSAGLYLGKHPMSPYHGGPRHGPTPDNGPRHGSPSRHHSPGPHSGPGRHRRERHHHSPGSHLGSDHHGRRHHHSHSPGRHAGPGGHYRDRVGGRPWGHYGRHSFTGRSGPHLLRQHQGEGSVPIKVAESQEGYLIFAEVPGLPRKHLAAQLDRESGLLIISGSYSVDPATSSNETILQERRHEQFRWEFRLPKDVAAERISAKLENGELTLSLPKIAKPELTTMPALGDDSIPAQAMDARAPTKPDKEAAPTEEDGSL